MSERLTDDRLSLLERALANIENDYKPTCESVSYGSGCPGATAESIDFWRRAVDALPSLIAEVRQRRAADLSEEDREALREFREAFGGSHYTEAWNRALAVLDRMLGRQGAQ